MKPFKNKNWFVWPFIVNHETSNNTSMASHEIQFFFYLNFCFSRVLTLTCQGSGTHCCILVHSFLEHDLKLWNLWTAVFVSDMSTITRQSLAKPHGNNLLAEYPQINKCFQEYSCASRLGSNHFNSFYHTTDSTKSYQLNQCTFVVS